MSKYDYLVVGSGLYGAIFAHEANKRGKKVLVIDKRPNIAGNVYTEDIEKIHVHKYGAHIFHTNNTEVWNYVNRFATFNRFTNSPVANYKGELYSMPFNMYTFNKMWGVVTPEEAAAKIEEQKKEITGEPQNLEEQAISLVGRDIFEKLIKGYTEKQWGRKCTELPAFIIKRLPVRMVFDNNYFNDTYQGIPIGGYNKLIDGLLDGVECHNNIDFFDLRNDIIKNHDGSFTLDASKNTALENNSYCFGKIVFTGQIDEFYDYKYGKLNFRTVRFEQEIIDKPNYQGNAVVNYTEREIPYTRIIEHKHFEYGTQPVTVITYEYPDDFQPGKEPYYPVNDKRNTEIYQKYKELAQQLPNVLFGGRLAQYAYADMDDTVNAALTLWRKQTRN